MSQFGKRFGSGLLAAIAIGSAAVAAGHQTKSGVPSARPGLIRPHVIATQGPIAPSQALINSQLATRTDIGPGTLYVQTYPSDQQQNAPAKHRPNTLLSPLQGESGISAARTRLHGRIGQPNLVLSGSANVTGINHWWTYEEDAIAGLGKYMANVTTGNLIVQADDMATPHKGIELAFRRTYNSFSQHDYANSDGSVPNNYGDGWTNTFDAHIAHNDLNNGISVFDIDGARYDYSYTCSPICGYVAPPGQFATLTYVATTSIFAWTKKTGAVYWFNSPNASVSGVAGRLLEIVGRNSNTFLKFAYYFDANYTDYTHLNEIRVVPEWAGPPASATSYVDLKFSDYDNGHQGYNRLLYKLFWIDGTTFVEYLYNQSCTLGTLWEPNNNSNSPNPSNPAVVCLHRHSPRPTGCRRSVGFLG